MNAAEQLALIERMVREGQRSFGRHGWIFVLWGVGHLGAIGWQLLQPARGGLGWAVLMAACGIATGVGLVRQERGRPKATAVGRALGAVWLTFGLSLALFWGVGLARDRFADGESFLFVFFVLEGSACVASAVILSWPLQGVVGAAWWITALVTTFVPAATTPLFVAMAVVAEVGFGVWMMRTERRAGALG